MPVCDLFTAPGMFSDQGVTHLILPHINDSRFHVSLSVTVGHIDKKNTIHYPQVHIILAPRCMQKSASELCISS